MQIKKCHVLRGVSGSGKTYLARDICNSASAGNQKSAICSADHYFMMDGEYKFNPSKLGEAHRYCHREAEAAMSAGVECVVIDNTHLTMSEIIPFAEMAVVFDYDLEIDEPCTPWWLSVRPLLEGRKLQHKIQPHCKYFAAKNAHGVGEHIILRMLMRWENMTPEKVLQSIK